MGIISSSGMKKKAGTHYQSNSPRARLLKRMRTSSYISRAAFSSSADDGAKQEAYSSIWSRKRSISLRQSSAAMSLLNGTRAVAQAGASGWEQAANALVAAITVKAAELKTPRMPYPFAMSRAPSSGGSD